MEYDDYVDGVSPEAMESLKLPAAFDEAAHVTALNIDAFLTQEERPVATLDAKVAAHRDVALSQLLTHRGTQTFDINLFRWPASLYIPKGANARTIGLLVPHLTITAMASSGRLRQLPRPTGRHVKMERCSASASFSTRRRGAASLLSLASGSSTNRPCHWVSSTYSRS